MSSTQAFRPQKPKKTLFKRISNLFQQGKTLYLLIGVAIGAVSIVFVQSITTQPQRLLESFVPELIGVAIIIRFMQLMNQKRDDENEKTKLIDALQSDRNEIALTALNQLSAKGWTYGEESVLANRDLSGSNLELARFWYANLVETRFTNANLSKAEFWNANLIQADFKGANLEGAMFLGANLENADFSGSKIADTTWRSANLRGAILINMRMKNLNFTKADLSQTYLMGSIFEEANLWDVNLMNSNVQEVKFDGSQLNFVRLNHADARDASFKGCDLTRANFEEADLTNADLSESMLGNTYFYGTNLTGANLEGARVAFKDADGQVVTVRMDSRTILPDGKPWDMGDGLSYLKKFGCIVEADPYARPITVPEEPEETINKIIQFKSGQNPNIKTNN